MLSIFVGKAPKNDIDKGVYMDVHTTLVQSECSISSVMSHRQSGTLIPPSLSLCRSISLLNLPLQ